MDILYTAEALATGGGRNGHVRTADGILDIDVRVPKEMGGAGGAPNPELLFAAGYAACFESAMRYVARQQKAPLKGAAVTATVELHPHDGGGFRLGVALAADVEGLDEAAAHELVETAHKVCPYSNAVRGNVDVRLTTTVR